MSDAAGGSFQTHFFLFSDIEGSTRLLEQFPEPMRQALQEHDARLRRVFAQYQGEVFKTLGGAFCVRFDQIQAAVGAALASQQRIKGLTVVEGEPLQVRISVHAGLAEARDDDYFGPALNRTARQLGVAHGEQVLVSEAAARLLGEGLPAHASLRDLGKHRLKDLGPAETIYQLCHPELADTFPPLLSLAAVPNNLPQPTTDFVGRAKALAEVRELLGRHRLVTLVGPGGIGKTRLALQVAAEALEQLPDGAFFLDLAALSDPSLVPSLLAKTLELPEQLGKTMEAALQEYLKPRTLLLLWDNVEHLLEPCAALIGRLLQVCPGLKVLTTSRELLGVFGEQLYQVPSFGQQEATDFFIARARLQQSSFVATSDSVGAIGRICARLEGIPLALELAAARVRTLSPEQIEARLDDVFRLLTGSGREALPRQQTLQALIDWSYALLSEAERQLLRRLSVFLGGWTLEAAEAICGGSSRDAEEVLDLLTALVEKSLVVVDELGGVSRYRLLEVLRQYSSKRFRAEEPDDEKQVLERAYLEWFVALGRRAASALYGPDQGHWIKVLEADHDNLRSAQDIGGATTVALSADLVGFWWLRGYITEGRQRLQRVRERYPELPPDLQVRLLAGAALFAEKQGDYQEATTLQESCLALAQQLGNKTEAARALVKLGQLVAAQGEPERAHTYYEEGLQLFRDANQAQGEAWTLNILGILAFQQGHHERAHHYYQESLALQRRLGNPENIAACLNNLGLLAHHQGFLEKARALYEEVLQIHTELGDRNNLAATLHNLGSVARQGGELALAQQRLREALALEEELGEPRERASTLIELGAAVYGSGNPTDARRLLVEGSALVRQYQLKGSAPELLELWAQLALDQGQHTQAATLVRGAEALRHELGKPRSVWAQRTYERLQGALIGESAHAEPGWEALLQEQEQQALQNP